MITAIITILVFSLLIGSIVYLNDELSKYKPRSRLEVWQDAIDDANNVFDGETPKPQEIDDYILAVIQSQTEAK